MLTLFAAAEAESPEPMGFVVLGVALAALGLALYVRYRLKQAVRKNAAQKGWTPFTDQGTLQKFAPPFLHATATKESFDLAHHANINGQALVFFQYGWTVSTSGYNFSGDGALDRKGGSSSFDFAVACCTVPQNLGQLLVFPHSKVANIGFHDGLEKYNLEGDFGKYFDIYAPPGSHINALSILTPDVMAFLQDLGNRFRIELSGNHIWLVSDNPYELNRKNVDGFLHYAVQVQQKFAAKPRPNYEMQT